MSIDTPVRDDATPVLAPLAPEPRTSPEDSPALVSWCRGVGRAYAAGTQLVAGVLTDSRSFSFPLHHQAVSTVDLRVRSARETLVRGLPPVATAVLEHRIEALDLGGLEVTARTRTMIEAGRDQGGREADAAAALLALADALGQTPTPADVSAQLRAATGDPVGLTGSAYHASVLLDAHTGALLRDASTMERFAIASVAPHLHAPRRALVRHRDHDQLLDDTVTALEAGADLHTLGELATRSTRLGHELAPHPHLEAVLDLVERFPARGLAAPLGVSTSATSSRVALLFDASPAGRSSASRAALMLKEAVPESWVASSTSHGPQ